jgi:hypothetical protein
MAGSSNKQDTGKGSMVSVRLAADEEKAVRRMAAEKGESMSQVIRDAVMSLCAPVASVDYRLVQRSHSVSSSGLVVEAHGGALVPKMVSNQAYVDAPVR